MARGAGVRRATATAAGAVVDLILELYRLRQAGTISDLVAGWILECVYGADGLSELERQLKIGGDAETGSAVWALSAADVETNGKLPW